MTMTYIWTRINNDIRFPNTNFLKARKGSMASRAWASLIQGRDALIKGVC